MQIKDMSSKFSFFYFFQHVSADLQVVISTSIIFYSSAHFAFNKVEEIDDKAYVVNNTPHLERFMIGTEIYEKG